MPNPSATNQAEFRRVRDDITGKASSDANALLLEMCVDYEQRFPVDAASGSA